MSERYMSYDRKTFEKELIEIAESLGLRVGDFTEKQGRQKIEERVYELTTKNPHVRILVYSSIDPWNGQARENGGDAVRVNFYCQHKGKKHYKKHKTHQRINTLFANLRKSIAEANDKTLTNEFDRWLYAVSMNG